MRMANEEQYRTEVFAMPQVKCKNCGKIVSVPSLHNFSFSFNNHHCHGRWCLCDDCMENGVIDPKYIRFAGHTMRRNIVEFLSGLSKIISQYKLNSGEIFYKEEN